MSDLAIVESKEPNKDEKFIQNERLLRAWKAWHAEQLAIALNGAQGAAVAELMVVLDQLKLSSSAALFACLRRTNWTEVNPDVRFTVLHQINQTIARLRERNGLPPIDDPLPGQPDNVFRRVKAWLFPPSPTKVGSFPSDWAHSERASRDVTAAKASTDKRTG